MAPPEVCKEDRYLAFVLNGLCGWRGVVDYVCRNNGFSRTLIPIFFENPYYSPLVSEQYGRNAVQIWCKVDPAACMAPITTRTGPTN